MSQDEVEQILPGWQVASQAVARELAEWRRAHPKATLTEIETAVFEAMQKLQAQALGEVVQASCAPRWPRAWCAWARACRSHRQRRSWPSSGASSWRKRRCGATPRLLARR